MLRLRREQNDFEWHPREKGASSWKRPGGVMRTEWYRPLTTAQQFSRMDRTRAVKELAHFDRFRQWVRDLASARRGAGHTTHPCNYLWNRKDKWRETFYALGFAWQTKRTTTNNLHAPPKVKRFKIKWEGKVLIPPPRTLWNNLWPQEWRR